MHKYVTLEDTVYFWFGANDTGGSGADGSTPVFDVREGGAASNAAPTLSGSATLLSHANYPDGAHEIAVAATAGNGFAANKSYAVFCTLLVDSQNPTGFIGSFDTFPAPANVKQYGGTAGTFASGRPEVNTTHWAGTAVASVNVLIDGAITAAKIADNAITSAKIADGAFTAAKFAAGAFDAVWSVATRTLTSFGTLAADVWSVATRTLTAATNISGPIADQVWEEAIADHSGTVGSTAEALAAAGSAGDPWSTALPGAYGTGTAGKIVGDNINATISSRATQTSVDTIDGIVDTILLDTNELQTDWTNGGRLDLILDDIDAQGATNENLLTVQGIQITNILAYTGALYTGQIIIDGATVDDATPSTTEFDTSLALKVDDWYRDAQVSFKSGDLTTHPARIVSSSSTIGGKTNLVFDEAWSQAPANTNQFTMMKPHVHAVSEIQGGLATSAEITALNDLSQAEAQTAAAAALAAFVIETGVTLQQALQRMGATTAGKASGAGTGTETFVGMDGSTNRVQVSVDNDGNRTAITYDP